MACAHGYFIAVYYKRLGFGEEVEDSMPRTAIDVMSWPAPSKVWTWSLSVATLICLSGDAMLWFVVIMRDMTLVFFLDDEGHDVFLV